VASKGGETAGEAGSGETGDGVSAGDEAGDNDDAAEVAGPTVLGLIDGDTAADGGAIPSSWVFVASKAIRVVVAGLSLTGKRASPKLGPLVQLWANTFRSMRHDPSLAPVASALNEQSVGGTVPLT
jgi:hypothetical protein